MDMAKEGKFALITGGTSGIGYELAKLFAQDGYNLIIVSENPTELLNRAVELEMYGHEVVAKLLPGKGANNSQIYLKTYINIFYKTMLKNGLLKG